MSSELLRRAAALMRERAEVVTSGGQWTDGNYWITDYDPSDPSGQTAMQRLIGGMDQPDATHYASWHPAVALAVADWLADVAADVDADLWPDGHDVPRNALTVATTYLGDQS